MKSASKPKSAPGLPLDLAQLRPGLRLAVALSGGADSVALLRALAARREELGLVLHAAHLHHGLRGAEANGDLDFCRELAARLGLPFHEARVDVAAAAKSDPQSGKPVETIEEAARRLRYAWFRTLLSKTPPHAMPLDAVATAHTLDDQAETVLAKFLRGAWTEGLAGIAPRLAEPEGEILRPLLGATRAEIEAYLRGLGQPWREDSSNRHLTFTRNRIRHELLPLLETWNPQLRTHLRQMAELARGEETWWQAELLRLAPQLILPGRPTRGGGRAAGSSDCLAIEIPRLAALPVALARRLVRHAASQLGVALDFAATEAVCALAREGRAGQRLELARALIVERTARELRFALAAEPSAQARDVEEQDLRYEGTIPGVIEAPAFGLRLRIERDFPKVTGAEPNGHRGGPLTATLRNWKPGDRVRLRYSSGPRKVKEVLERLHVTGSERSVWPVLEIEGRIAWMRGVALEPEPGVSIVAEQFAPEDSPAVSQKPPEAGKG